MNKFSDITITTVVVTYNGSQWINKCLDSLLNSTIDTKIIVIDNCSTDTTPSIIKTDYPSVEFIAATSNLGFGQGNNKGILKAYDRGADYVFLLNQDAWVKEDALEKMIELAETNKNYGIISPIHLNGSGDLIEKGFYHYSIKRVANPRTYYSSILTPERPTLTPATFVNAAAWLLSRRCIAEVGGFSRVFFHYGEDVDYANRVLYHGLKIGLVNNAFIHHDRSEDRPKANYSLSLKRNKIYIDSILSDINEKKWQLAAITILCKNIVKSTVTLDFQMVVVNFVTLLQLAPRIKRIRLARAKTKSRGLHFLE